MSQLENQNINNLYNTEKLKEIRGKLKSGEEDLTDLGLFDFDENGELSSLESNFQTNLEKMKDLKTKIGFLELMIEKITGEKINETEDKNSIGIEKFKDKKIDDRKLDLIINTSNKYDTLSDLLENSDDRKIVLNTLTSGCALIIFKKGNTISLPDLKKEIFNKEIESLTKILEGKKIGNEDASEVIKEEAKKNYCAFDLVKLLTEVRGQNNKELTSNEKENILRGIANLKKSEANNKLKELNIDDKIIEKVNNTKNKDEKDQIIKKYASLAIKNGLSSVSVLQATKQIERSLLTKSKIKRNENIGYKNVVDAAENSDSKEEFQKKLKNKIQEQKIKIEYIKSDYNKFNNSYFLETEINKNGEKEYKNLDKIYYVTNLEKFKEIYQEVRPNDRKNINLGRIIPGKEVGTYNSLIEYIIFDRNSINHTEINTLPKSFYTGLNTDKIVAIYDKIDSNDKISKSTFYSKLNKKQIESVINYENLDDYDSFSELKINLIKRKEIFSKENTHEENKKSYNLVDKFKNGKDLKYIEIVKLDKFLSNNTEFVLDLLKTEKYTANSILILLPQTFEEIKKDGDLIKFIIKEHPMIFELLNAKQKSNPDYINLLINSENHLNYDSYIYSLKGIDITNSSINELMNWYKIIGEVVKKEKNDKELINKEVSSILTSHEALDKLLTYVNNMSDEKLEGLTKENEALFNSLLKRLDKYSSGLGFIEKSIKNSNNELKNYKGELNSIETILNSKELNDKEKQLIEKNRYLIKKLLNTNTNSEEIKDSGKELLKNIASNKDIQIDKFIEKILKLRVNKEIKKVDDQINNININDLNKNDEQILKPFIDNKGNLSSKKYLNEISILIKENKDLNKNEINNIIIEKFNLNKLENKYILESILKIEGYIVIHNIMKVSALTRAAKVIENKKNNGEKITDNIINNELEKAEEDIMNNFDDFLEESFKNYEIFKKEEKIKEINNQEKITNNFNIINQRSYLDNSYYIKNIPDIKQENNTIIVNGKEINGISFEEYNNIVEKNDDGENIIKNHEALKNLVDFKEKVDKLNISFVWKFRNELIHSMQQTTEYRDIKNIDSDNINDVELNKLLNFILEVVGEEGDKNSLSGTSAKIMKMNGGGEFDNKKDTISGLGNLGKKFEEFGYIGKGGNSFSLENQSNLLNYKNIIKEQKKETK